VEHAAERAREARKGIAHATFGEPADADDDLRL